MSVAVDLPDWARTLAEDPCWDVEPAPDSPTIVVSHAMGAPSTSRLLQIIENANGADWQLHNHSDQGIRLVFREAA